MPDFDFKSKWGALPIWAWGLIAGVVALIGYYIWARRNGASDGNTSATTTGSNIDAMGYQTAGIKGGSAIPDNTTVPANNTSWLANASRGVADTLGASPSDVYGALYKYVTGQDINSKEKTYVDKAIQNFMSPPEGTQGLGTVLPDPPAIYLPHSQVGVIRRTGSGDLAILYADNSKRLLSVADWVKMGSPNPNALPDPVYDAYKIVS